MPVASRSQQPADALKYGSPTQPQMGLKMGTTKGPPDGRYYTKPSNTSPVKLLNVVGLGITCPNPIRSGGRKASPGFDFFVPLQVEPP